ncbi:MAG: hypothetical protein IM533_18440 [Pseudanabaena sp. M007S1SP1A06QC]|nr:hypothetical protein [Pseudanabaena sp. M007S1SP1A06QC]
MILHKYLSLNLNSKHRSPLTTPKTRSPISPNQPAIAPQHIQKLIAYILKTKQ